MRTFFILVLFVSTAVARVGEKYEIFAKRVGPPVDPRSYSREGNRIFAMHKQGNVSIRIDCFDGTSAREQFSYVSRAEAEKLLQGQRKGKWEVDDRKGTDIVYTSPGPDPIVAYYSLPDQQLTVTDGRYEAWLKTQ
jgi:hypothetical protein